MRSNSDDDLINPTTILLSALFLLTVIALLFWAAPKYQVYVQQLSGEAKLREAESSRRVTVLEAQARLDSSKLNAQSEVERAKGVAQSNKIVGESLKGEEGDRYLRYVYITGLQEAQGQPGDRTVVYIPTDGLVPLPISEANRLSAPVAPSLPAPKEE
jgi:hypothetical protein